MEQIISLLAEYLYHKAGVREHGDFVAVLLPNTAYYTMLVLAIWKIGASAVLINNLLTPGKCIGLCG